MALWPRLRDAKSKVKSHTGLVRLASCRHLARQPVRSVSPNPTLPCHDMHPHCQRALYLEPPPRGGDARATMLGCLRGPACLTVCHGRHTGGCAGARAQARPVQPQRPRLVEHRRLVGLQAAHGMSLLAGDALRKHARHTAWQNSALASPCSFFYWGTHVRIVGRFVAVADELLQVLDVRLRSLA